MKNKDGVIVFGASGLIGKCLYNLFKEKNKPIVGTYHTNKKSELIYFDLEKSPVDSLNLDNVRYGIICSAVTNLDKCNDNPEYSHSVNVKAAERIVTELSEKAIVPVFMSTGAVFDGVEGGYKENSKRNPVSIYWKQKVEVEEFIFSNIKDYLIIRPGKVFNFKDLLSDWIKKYKNNETIPCADDEKLSFTSAEDVARGINLLLDKDSRGVYHINPLGYASRFDLISRFFRNMNIKDAKIKRCSIDDFGTKRAKNTYMDASKFIKETGFKFTDLDNLLT